MPCDPVKLLWLKNKANTTDKEVNDKVDNLAAIHIIELGDAKSFGDLAKDIMQHSHLVQDFYPKIPDGAFELMVQ